MVARERDEWETRRRLYLILKMGEPSHPIISTPAWWLQQNQVSKGRSTVLEITSLLFDGEGWKDWKAGYDSESQVPTFSFLESANYLRSVCGESADAAWKLHLDEKFASFAVQLLRSPEVISNVADCASGWRCSAVTDLLRPAGRSSRLHRWPPYHVVFIDPASYSLISLLSSLLKSIQAAQPGESSLCRSSSMLPIGEVLFCAVSPFILCNQG